MLWLLKRAVSLRRFLRTPKTHVWTDMEENYQNFMQKGLLICAYVMSQIKTKLSCFLTHISLASFCGTSANSAKPDQTPQNVASDQVLHCLQTEVFYEIWIKMKKKPHLTSLKTEIDCSNWYRREIPLGLNWLKTQCPSLMTVFCQALISQINSCKQLCSVIHKTVAKQKHLQRS